MLKRYFAVVMALLVLGGTSSAFADEWRGHGRDHDGDRDDRRGHYSERVIYRHLPFWHKRVIVRNVPYFYSSGVYYQSVPGGYVIVQPPVETVVVYRNRPACEYERVYQAETPRVVVYR